MQLELPVQQIRSVPVDTVMLYVSESCNLRCTYCFVNKSPRTMTLETARNSVDYLLSEAVSGQVQKLNISFFGGEPFLATDVILEIMAYAREREKTTSKRIGFYATTNGTLAGPKVERALKEGPIELLISMDGREDTHRFRPKISGAESYSHVAKNLPNLLKWSPKSSVRMTFHTESLDFVGNVRQAQEMGARSIVLAPVVEDPAWPDSVEQLEAAYVTLGTWFLEELFARRVPPLITIWNLLRQYAERVQDGLRPERACAVGANLIAISPDGVVLPCHRHLYRLHDQIGHVNQAAKLTSKRLDYLDIGRSETPACGTCVARGVCGGGCRIVALEGGYGFDGVHPNHCILTQAQMRMVDRLYRALRAHPSFRRLIQVRRTPEAFRELSGTVA